VGGKGCAFAVDQKAAAIRPRVAGREDIRRVVLSLVVQATHTHTDLLRTSPGYTTTTTIVVVVLVLLLLVLY
jgi:hypothetical protein